MLPNGLQQPLGGRFEILSQKCWHSGPNAPLRVKTGRVGNHDALAFCLEFGSMSSTDESDLLAGASCKTSHKAFRAFNVGIRERGLSERFQFANCQKAVLSSFPLS